MSQTPTAPQDAAQQAPSSARSAAHRPARQPVEPSLNPAGGGWHCSHLYYSFDRVALAAMTVEQRAEVTSAFAACLDPAADGQPVRMQAFIVSGHKADFGLMLMDPDPLVVDAVHQRLMASISGPVLQPGYSFVSVTEISEYVPSVEDYSKRVVAEGHAEGSETFETKVKAYADRLGPANKQRLTPDLPPHPAMCFYPMNKKREVGENWFTLPKEERVRLMSEHARSGMKYAGRVSQLITVGVGLEEWEWGVTLWAANPSFLKDIVYEMRFDEASARYAEFGPFLTGYIASADEITKHCHVACP